MPKALDGVAVVEFSSHPASAYAAMLLAEQGADVIRLSLPDDALRSGTPHYHVLNRSKQIFRADHQPDGSLSRRRELISWADIIICGCVPGRQVELGLDHPSVREINPHALLLAMPPLGSRGPYAELAAENDLVEAFGGINAAQWSRSGKPVAQTFPAASYQAGIIGATAAVAALFARDQGVGGQEIEVSVLAGAMWLQTGAILKHPRMIRLFEGPQDPLGPSPVYRLFEAADGKYLFIACGNSRFWHRLALLLERPDLISDPRFENAPWGVQGADKEILRDIVANSIKSKPRDEWLSILRESEIPCAPVMTRAECIDSPQVRSIGMRREVADPVLGLTVQSGVPVKLHSAAGDITGPAPVAQRNPDLVPLARKMIVRVRERIQQSIKRGPLDGILVLDFSGYIAGSLGPMLLGQFGADVLKVESLDGDAFRSTMFGFLGWNQNKRGIALNIGMDQGREIIYELVKHADIVVENMRPGGTRTLGIDYETLSAINPRIIYTTVTGFGSSGPDCDRPGFDPLAQALSGVMAAHSGKELRGMGIGWIPGDSNAEHPLYITAAIGDYGAAALSAFGCLLALRLRQNTGHGEHCETSVLAAALALQAGEFIFYQGRPNLEIGAPELRGISALHRAYECRGGRWIFVSISKQEQWNRLRLALPDIGALPFAAAKTEGPYSELAGQIARAIGAIESKTAVDILTRADVPALTVNHPSDLFTEPQITANDLVTDLSHTEFGMVGQLGAAAKFSATPSHPLRSAPLLGEHTDFILQKYLCYSSDRITELRAANVIR
jgi:crotonobetainyl-CoA:carnitine CoA-transferase CaiB-like acyl-CoA transferase